jgi:hypothetical protein
MSCTCTCASPMPNRSFDADTHVRPHNHLKAHVCNDSKNPQSSRWFDYGTAVFLRRWVYRLVLVERPLPGFCSRQARRNSLRLVCKIHRIDGRRRTGACVLHFVNHHGLAVRRPHSLGERQTPMRLLTRTGIIQVRIIRVRVTFLQHEGEMV